jgi:hypothetical protein
MKISITADTSKARKYLQDAQQAADRAKVSALNKIAVTARAEASRLIAARRGLKVGTVKQQIRIIRASRDLARAEIVVSGRPIPLRDYAARQTKRGTTVVVTKGQRKLVRSGGNAGFQIVKIGNNVFVREGKRRLPIRKLYGPSLPSTFSQKAITEAVTKAAREAWPKRYREELANQLRRISK